MGYTNNPDFMKKATGITQQQIADYVGVSRMSVVRAFQGDPKVSPDRRQQILAAARALGYHAGSNEDARSLVGRRYGQKPRHNVLGYVGFQVGSDGLYPYGHQIMVGANEMVKGSGGQLLLLDRSSLQGWEKVDGVLMHAAGPEEMEFYRDLGVPLVVVMREVQGFCSIDIDNFQGARLATEHLLSLGHKRIGFLLCLEDEHVTIMQRKRGHEAAMLAAGLELDPRWVGRLQNSDGEDFLDKGRNSMRSWIEGDWAELELTALLVQNDRAAVGAMETLTAAGIRIPDQLSVVGFDSTVECEIVRPNLTSVHLPLREIGALGTQLLQRAVNSEIKEPETRILELGLDVRASSAPPG